MVGKDLGMASDFSNTLDSLRADSLWRRLAWLGVAFGVLAAWLLWFVGARVPISESSPARLEVSQTAHPVEAQVEGHIARIHVRELNGSVSQGDLLFELNSEPQRLELEEVRARLHARTAQKEFLENEQRLELAMQPEVAQTSKLLHQEALARYRQASVLALRAEEEAARIDQLLGKGFASEAQRQQSVAELQQHKEMVEVLRLAMDRTTVDSRLSQGARRASLERLKRELSVLEGAIASDRWQVERLTYEIERRRIRAPISGQLAESAPVQVSRYVREGERLSAILPPGQLRVVADFEPRAAIARIHPGQKAFMRLDGFPWTQFGRLPVIVSGVASEVRDGRIRVELSIPPMETRSLLLQHGMTGTVDVELARASPASLALQALGRRLDGLGNAQLRAPGEL